MESDGITTPETNAIAESLGAPLGELALATIAIARALRPQDADSLGRYENSLQTAIDRSRPDQDLLREILRAAME